MSRSSSRNRNWLETVRRPPLCLSAEMQDLMAKRQSNCKARNTPLSQISTMFTVCTGETDRNNTLAYITRDPACSHDYSCIGYLGVIWLKFWFHATAIATIDSERLGLHAKSEKIQKIHHRFLSGAAVC